MADLIAKLKDIRSKIKSLADKENLTPEEAKDLEKFIGEAKNIQLQQAGVDITAEQQQENDKVAEGMDESTTKAFEAIMKRLEKIPGLDSAGYLTNMGGTNDPANKSFGDFLLAVRRDDRKRLHGVYKSIKTLEEDSGTAGGYTVPEEYHNQMLKMGEMANSIVALTTSVPVGTDAGSYPALDQFTAPTAGVGDTAFAGKVKVTSHVESGTIDTNEPAFTEIKYRINDIGDLVYVSKNLQADSAQSIEAILTGLFRIAILGKREFFLFRGTGAGEPLGILNSPAIAQVSPSTNNLFSYIDATTMVSRVKSYMAPARWFMHPSVFPDTANWEIGTNGAGVANIAGLGYGTPLFSEHLPQANNSGDVILADLKAYLFFDRQTMTVDYSEHAAFTTNRVVWRVNERLDGMPWLKGAITLADPQGSYTVSPFVVHND